MGRPARLIKRIPILLRFEPEDLMVIDTARGEQDRHGFIVEAALKAAARKPRKQVA